MDPKIAKKTQDTLGKIIKKPPLTDKLLGKPPFRFLHDIMTSVIKTTGFMKGLFTDSELNSENVKDKDSKIAFLQKSIDFICLVSGKSLSAKPSKIVAGHEPEKTNDFLVALANAINAKVDNDEYIKKFFNKGKDSKDDTKKDRSKDRTDEKRKRDREEKRDRGKSADRDRDDRGEKEDRKEREEKKDRERSRDREKEDRHRDRDREKRRKVVEQDTLADLLTGDDDGDDTSDSDMDAIFDGLSESDFNDPNIGTILRQRKEQLKPKRGEEAGPNYASYVGTNVEDKKLMVQEYVKPSRANRPGAARQRPNRRPDMPSDENITRQPQTEPSAKTRPDMSTDVQNQDIENDQITSLKKRKSGTKSRMSNRSTVQVRSPAGATLVKSPKKSSKAESLKITENKKSKTRSIKEQEVDTDVRVRQTGSKSSPKKGSRTSSKSTRRGSTDRRKSTGKETAVKPFTEQEDRIFKTDRRQSNFDMMIDSATQDRHIEHERDYESRKHRDEDVGKENETPAEMVNGDADQSEPEPPPRLARPTSAKGSRRRREGRAPVHSDEEDEGQTRSMRASEPAVGEGDLPPQVAAARSSARPSSARPAPPKRKQEIVENEPAMRLGSGKPTNVIVDDGKGDDEDDDDETFVVEESAPPPPEPEQNIAKPSEDGEDEDHGGLVKKMLETKKELEGGSQQKSQSTKKTEIERPTLTDAQRRKQREQIQKEIDKLRGSIQTLTRSANPLGKIMDYVQEDLDSMQKELEKWKVENKEHALSLKREKSITDKAIEPLKAQLSEVDQAISDQLDLIAAVKSNIIRNDVKIEKMLTSIAKS